MNQDLLTINPGIRIIHRKGALFAGQMSGVARPVQLLEFDIVLLFHFLLPGKPEEAVNRLLGEEGRSLFSSLPSAPALFSRIQQLVQAGVLMKGETGQPSAPSRPVTLDDCRDARVVSAETSFRMGTNIALRPRDGLFRAWSPSRRDNYYPGPDLCLLLYNSNEFAYVY